MTLAEGGRFLPSVISFGGTGSSVVVQGKTERPISVGDSIQYGATIRTGENNSVTLQYPDNSLLTVDAQSELQIQERRGGVQAQKLNTGQIRASVVKLKNGQTVQNKPRFIVRTRAAVLGVRGTEFAMAVDPTGYTTQVHTLEGLVDVAADEGGLLSGKATSLESGKFIEASEKGVSAPQVFDREDFERSLKPATPDGVSQPVFTGPGGRTIERADVTKLADPRTLDLAMPGFRKAEEEKKKEEAKKDTKKQDPENPREQSVESKPDRPRDEPRRIRLLSFQAGYLYSPGIRNYGPYYSGPCGPPANPPCPTNSVPNSGVPTWADDGGRQLIANGVTSRTPGLHISWDPTVPIPLTGILSARGHFGWNYMKTPDARRSFHSWEAQVFANVTLFDKIYGEIGVGKQRWPELAFDAGLLTVNAGFMVRTKNLGFELDRIYVGHSDLKTKPEMEEFRAGVGFGF